VDIDNERKIGFVMLVRRGKETCVELDITVALG
jgi:hypothetical protein